jgi:glucans biosynthesis protein C
MESTSPRPPSLALPSSRRADLDGLRVAAILLLHLFHVGMMFNGWGWHLKNPEPLHALEPPMELLHYVRMPLLMVVAGAATAFALERRGAGAFFVDRVKRLLGPVIFGMLVIVPPQIYLERLASGAFTGSYLDFYPQVFSFVPYPRGAFSWHHLWFVVYLFVYSVVLLPVLARLRSPLRLPPAMICLAFVPLAAIHVWLRAYPETHALIDDPRTLLYYGVLFFYGHLLGRSPEAWAWLARARTKLTCAFAVICAVMLPPNEWPFPLEHVGAFAFVWFAILTALAWAPSWFPRRTPRLQHAQGLAYPFYILHQTVILLVGWGALKVPMGAWPRFGFVLITSLLATWALCEIVARLRWLRPLLGMPPRKPEPARVSSAAQ